MVSLVVQTEQVADRAMYYIKEYGPNVLSVIVIISVAWILAGWTRRVIRRGFERVNFDLTLSKFIANTVKWIILAFAGVACLRLFGIETTSFAVLIGAAGFAIGLGLQGSLSHLAAGVMLLIFRPFKVGNTILVGGQTGTVHEIDLFTTSMDTADGRRIIVPNGSIFGNTIENISHHPRRRIDIPITTPASADLDSTRAVLAAAVRRIPGAITDPAAEVGLDGFTPVAVNWVVRVWAPRETFGAVKEAAIREVKAALDHAGITPAPPRMDVYVKQMPGQEE